MRIAWIPVLSLIGVGSAYAAPVDTAVNCSQGKSINDAISKMNDKSKDFSITVSGTCNENVVISDFQGNSLILQGTPGAVINGVPNVPFAVPVIQVISSRLITITNLIVNVTGSLPTGNQAGISLLYCDRCTITGVTVNSARSGITAADSRGSINNAIVNINGLPAGDAISVVISSDMNVNSVQLHGPGGVSPPGVGLLVDGSSRAHLSLTSVSSPNMIDGFSSGITVRNNAYLEGASACSGQSCTCSGGMCTTVTNNSQGIRLEGARTFLNGLNVTANLMGGIFVGTASSAELVGPFAITGATTGVGLTVTHNSHAAVLGNGATFNISGNPPRAASVGNVSSLEFEGTISVSGLVNCDSSSKVTGTSSAVGADFTGCTNTSPMSVPLP